MFGRLGLPELLIVAVIALLVFGPKKLPDLGAGLGKAIRDFKGALSDKETSADEEKQKQKELQPK